MKAQELPRDDDGQLSAFAWPGGYPLYYLTEDGGVLCPEDARMAERDKLAEYDDGTFDPQWHIIAADANWEDPEMYCDHCGNRIPSAYAEDDAAE
jgi:hypothetical protein